MAQGAPDFDLLLEPVLLSRQVHSIMASDKTDSEKGQSRPTVIRLVSESDALSLPRDATDDEIRSFPRVVDSIPLAAWGAALVGSSERFSYYATVSVWRKKACFFNASSYS